MPDEPNAEPAADRRARRHATTRAEILEAAWSLAHERGLSGWSLRELAATVGMRAPSLYVYFTSKDAIFDAMIAQTHEQLLQRLDTVVGDSPDQRLLGTAQVFLDFCTQDRSRYQLLFEHADAGIPHTGAGGTRSGAGSPPSAPSRALADAVDERFRGTLADAGVTKPDALDLWTAMLAGLAAQQIHNDPGGDRWTRRVGEVVRRFLDAERPPGGAQHSSAHVSLVTLGVDDLAVATRFYETMGWRRSAASVDGTVSFLRGGATVLSLFGRGDLEAEAGVEAGAPRRTSVALAMNLPSEAAVDAALATAARAGGDVTRPAQRAEWGGYSGYFTDPDGHLWEVAHNPGFGLLADGRVRLPDE